MVLHSPFPTFSDFLSSSEVDECTASPISLSKYQGPLSQVEHPSLNVNSAYCSSHPADQDPANFLLPIPTTSGTKSFDWLGPGNVNGRSNTLSKSSYLNAELGSNSCSNDFSKHVLTDVSRVLLEENMEEDKLSMLHDPSALRATEKSLSEVLGGKPPAAPDQSISLVRQTGHWPKVTYPRASFANYTSINRIGTISCTDYSREKQKDALAAILEGDRSLFLTCDSLERPANPWSNSQSSWNPPNSFMTYYRPKPVSSAFDFPQQHTSFCLTASEFKRSLLDARKFIPGDVTKNMTNSKETKGVVPYLERRAEKEQEVHPQSSKGRKNHEREELCEMEGRTNKQQASSPEESDQLSELFDSILLGNHPEPKPSKHAVADGGTQNAAAKNVPEDKHTRGSSRRKIHTKKCSNNKEDVVDLMSLLIQCAQAISVNDSRNASELMQQIRFHSSPVGDGSQRLAHYFANGLEARLAGTNVEDEDICYSSFTCILQLYQTEFEGCPCFRIAFSFANNMIVKVSETAATLHVLDFGIIYGFQWPLLIRLLSQRPGGPPKLKLTGIDLPRRGLRPNQRLAEVGRHLESYCKRFGVPFEYRAIVSSSWETISIKELKIDKDEFLAINCRYHFQHLLDETVVTNNPRDAVLKLIRDMKPDIFVQSAINGCYNSPFFVKRFQEAIFHFSSIYDMLDSRLPRHDKERMVIEREHYGREVMNVISCEGTDRVERPETYKQWQTRITQAGFRQLPLDRKLMKTHSDTFKALGQRDFVIDEDGNWMLQGWKGRILYASCCWVPA